LLLTVCGLASLLALGLRFRRSRGIERQQLKWLVYAAAMTLLVIIATQGFQRWQLGAILLFPVLASVPAAAGIAILRYRLYDIDRIINRTLVYGLLTVLLGAVYVGGMFTLGRLLNPITGESSLAVAASTLAVAALFRRPGAVSKPWWIAASTGAATMQPGPWRPSAPACGTRST
jgi:hypothetical protein